MLVEGLNPKQKGQVKISHTYPPSLVVGRGFPRGTMNLTNAICVYDWVRGYVKSLA